MANVRVDVSDRLLDGQTLVFKAPCDCTEITGLIIYYPEIIDNEKVILNKEFTFRDTRGADLSNITGLFVQGAYVSVVLDTNNNYAYLLSSPVTNVSLVQWED